MLVALSLAASAHDAAALTAATLVRDINLRPNSSSPRRLVRHDDSILFIARGELWRLGLEDTAPSQFSQSIGLPVEDIVAQTTAAALFTTHRSDLQLWATDGTINGTQKLAVFGHASKPLSEFHGIGESFVFLEHREAQFWRLWRTDGTSDGTRLIIDQVEGSLATMAGSLFFFRDGSLCRSNDRGDDIVQLFSGRSEALQPPHLIACGSHVFFFSRIEQPFGRELWSTDGTSAGTRNLGARTVSPDARCENGLLSIQDWSGNANTSRWVSDGTVQGTYRQAAATTPRVLAEFEGQRRLLARDTSPATLLLDGPSGTVELGSFDRVGGYLGRDVGSVYFSAAGGGYGDELWRSDLTPEGTSIVRDVNPGSSGSEIRSFTGLGSRHVFTAEVGSQRELWVTDGTDVGTHILVDLFPGTVGSAAAELMAYRQKLFFRADDGERGPELWASDGTEAGTAIVVDLKEFPSPWVGGDYYGVGSRPEHLTVAGPFLFFGADTGFYGRELVVSDGTAAGTDVASDIARHSYEGSWPSSLTELHGDVLFTARDNLHFDRPSRGAELYRFDSRSGVTTLVRDINAGPSSSTPSSLTRGGDHVFFAASDSHGSELWRTDGSTASTQLVRDLRPGLPSSLPTFLKWIGHALWFSADDGIGGRELWRSDGTRGGTRLVADIRAGASGSNPVPLGGDESILLVAADDGTVGRELWRANGNAVTKLVKDIAPGAASSDPTDLVSANGHRLFVADDRIHGRELWRTDGTESGTILLKDIQPGPQGSNPSMLREIDETVVFRACSSLGCEVWISDGTAVGTRQLADIHPGPESSDPAEFTAVESRLFFTAFHPDFGTELWSIPRTALLHCFGDCDEDRRVTVDEILKLVDVALGNAELGSICPAGESDGDGKILVDEILGAIDRALVGCAVESAHASTIGDPGAMREGAGSALLL